MPLFQALDARARGRAARVDRPVGYGFPVRICDQDPTAPIYLYSATISSIDRFDLVFDAVEPPFGTPISPGGGPTSASTLRRPATAARPSSRTS